MWMLAKLLNLDESKTEATVFSQPSPAISTQTIGSLAPNIRHLPRPLGVILNSFYRSYRQVSAAVRNSFFQN